MVNLHVPTPFCTDLNPNKLEAHARQQNQHNKLDEVSLYPIHEIEIENNQHSNESLEYRFFDVDESDICYDSQEREVCYDDI